MTRKGSQVQVLYGPPRLTCEYRAFGSFRRAQVRRDWGSLWGDLGRIRVQFAPSQPKIPEPHVPFALLSAAALTSSAEATEMAECADVDRSIGRSSTRSGGHQYGDP